MEKKNLILIANELIWWCITAVIVYLVLYPIHKAMQEWPYQGCNIFLIISFITLIRYTFLLKYTLFSRRQIVKIVLFLLMFPFAFILIDSLNGFMTWVDENGWDQLTGHLPMDQKRNMESYIWGEMLFFGVGSVLATPAFAYRMLVSVWRTRNLDTV